MNPTVNEKLDALRSRLEEAGAPKIAKKLATSGSLEELKKLVAEFYYSKPEHITFIERDGYWRVQSGEKVVTPIVIRQGKRFVFGTA